jgi:hypothetical protein
MPRTIDVTPAMLADIRQCFTEVARYAAMCAEIEAAGGYNYEDADAVQADAGVQAIEILEALFPDLVTWRQEHPAPFTEGERVLYSVTGEWGMVARDGDADASPVLLDGRGYEIRLPNGTLIPEDQVDPDPYDEPADPEEGWKK